MDIVFADISYLDVIANIERSCFPEKQAAKKHQFCERLSVYPKHFLLAKDDSGDIAAFINGFVTDLADLTDEMYTTPSLHDENGAWQMVFGLCTRPEYRHRGIAKSLMEKFLSLAEEQGRKGAVLTCKQSLIGFYEQFGFVNEGISQGSVIGGVQWYRMRKTF